MDGNRFLLAGIDFSRFFSCFLPSRGWADVRLENCYRSMSIQFALEIRMGTVVRGDNRLNGTNWDGWELTAGVQ